MLVAALFLAPGLAGLATLDARRAALAPSGWRALGRARAPIAWGFVAASLLVAITGYGAFGLVAWVGLVPLLGGALLLVLAYRPRAAVALPAAGLLMLALGWFGGA